MPIRRLPTPEELYPDIKKRKPTSLTTQQAKRYGYTIPEDWTLNFDYEGEEPKPILVSPEKWEFRDLIYGDEGLQDYLALSPEGKRYNKAELAVFEAEQEALEAERKTILPQLEPYKTPEGYNIGEARKTIPEEILIKVFGEEALQPPKISEPVTMLLRNLYPEMFVPEASYGFTEEEKPQMVWDTLMRQLEESPADFAEQLQAKGRNRYSEAFLRELGATPEGIEEFYQGIGAEKPVIEPPPKPIETIFASIEGIRQPVIRTEDNSVYNRQGNWVGFYNWADKTVFNPYKQEGLLGKAGASFTAGIGDILSTSGGAARWLGFEDTANKLSTIGKELQMYGVPDSSADFQVSDLLNPEFYATKIVRTIPFALSLAPLAIGGFYAGAGLAATVGLGTIGQMVIGGLAGAALSRPAESAMEAGSQYDDAIARGKPEKEAKEEADEVFRNNMKLAGADAWEIAIALAPTPKWVPMSLIKSGLVRTAQITGKMVIVGLSEGGEEVYQDMIQRHARGEEWKLDPISKEVFAIGAIMGVGMGFGGDVIQEVVNRSKQSMSAQMRQEFDNLVEENQGADNPELHALDGIAKTPEGKSIISKVINALKGEEGFVRIPGEIPKEGKIIPEITPRKFIGVSKSTEPTQKRAPWVVTYEYKGKEHAGHFSSRVEAAKWAKEKLGVELDPKTLELITPEKPAPVTPEVTTGVKFNRPMGGSKGGLAIMDYKTTTPITDEVAREQIISAYNKVKNPVGYATYNAIKKETGLSYETILGVLKQEHINDPHQIHFNVDRMGKNVFFKYDKKVPIPKAEMPEAEIPEFAYTTTEIDAMASEAEGIKAWLETDPVAQERFTIGGKRVDITHFISIRERTYPDYFTLKEAKALMPGYAFAEYTQKGTPQYNHVPKEVALDDLTKRLGMTPDEIIDRGNQVYAAKQRLNTIQAGLAKAPPPVEVAPPIEPPPPDRPVPPADTLPPAPTPPEIKPTRSGENVIGLRTIQPGLVRSETIGNIFKRAISKLGVQVAEADPLANAAMNERVRVHSAIESNANVLGTKAEAILNKVFIFDKKGRIPALDGIDTTIDGAPTIQDVAARLPTYRPSLSEAQINALTELREMVQPYRQLLDEVGVEVSERQDVISGGFYLPRGRAALEGVDEPVKIGAGRRGMRKGFERPAFFDSQAEGINKGFEYAPIGDALSAYANDAGVRATDAHVVNYFKVLTDDAGNLLGETVKMRLMRQNPEIAKVVEEINDNLTKLRRNIGALTQRQMDVIDLWQNDPEFNDIDVLLDGLETMRGGIPARTLPELRVLFEQNKETLKALRPSYKKALRQAQATPRDQGVIILPALAGRTFPVELSNAANEYLMKEGKTIGALAPVVNVANAINNLYRGVTATLDNSAMGIQGLLGMYGQPRAYVEALKVNIQAWGIGGDKILGKFLVEFDAQAIQNGRLTSSDWARAGLHLGGATHEFQLGGARTSIGNLPAVRQANRAFGYLGDALRLEWADSELSMQQAKRSLNNIRESGDLERIADASNVMTGWHTKKFAGSLGDLMLYAPRFFQSRLSTIAKAGMGLRPNATLDQRMARMALLKMIGFGTVLTILGNMVAGEDDTDFRLIVDGKRNPKFMRIKFGGNYYSLFGTWDSLLGVFINIGTGRPIQAFRAMTSGIVKGAWDIMTGRDYNFKAVTDTPMHFIQWLGNSLVPFAVGEIPLGAKQFAGGIITGEVREAISGAIQIISRIIGYKSFPERDWKENRVKLGLFIYDDPALYSTENPIYTYDRYASDTLAKLGKTSPSEVIGNKDYPKDVQAIVQSREWQRELANYPNRKLTSVNADLTKGDTYIEFYKQWQKQQELVDAGDKAEYTDLEGVKHTGEDAVAAFKSDYKQSEQGNMTQRQFVLLTQYHQITDPKWKAEFLKANPELSANPYQDWLKSHPKENAYLAITGDAKILTKEAYNQFLGLIKTLDIPDSAIPPMTLPPETSIDTHFKYEEMITEGKHGSWEAQLLLLKDAETAKEAKVQSYADWHELKLSDTPIASLEIKTKPEFRTIYDKIQNLGDKDSPTYIDPDATIIVNGKKVNARAEAIKKLKTPEYIDNTRRIEAIEKGTDEAPIDEREVNAHVEYGKLIDQEGVGSSSAEVMLYRVDNPDYDAWRMDENIWGDNALTPIDESRIPIWRIDVKYAKEDTEYNAIKNPLPAEQARLRDEYMVAHPEYRMDSRRREGYGLTNSKTGEAFPREQVENYAGYYELPTKGFRQERFLILNPEFAEVMHRIKGIDLPTKVPAVQYDDIYDQYKKQFDELDGLADNESEFYIEDVKERESRAKTLRFTKGRYNNFGLAEVRREGYGKFVPENQIENYVAYYRIIGEGKPKGQDKWYEDDWFLMEHPEFYQNVYKILLGNQKRDFRKVPTREVFGQYQRYLGLIEGKPRDDFRWEHPALDDWLVSLGYKSVTEQKRRAALTPKEKLGLTIAEMERRLREHP